MALSPWYKFISLSPSSPFSPSCHSLATNPSLSPPSLPTQVKLLFLPFSISNLRCGRNSSHSLLPLKDKVSEERREKRAEVPEEREEKKTTLVFLQRALAQEKRKREEIDANIGVIMQRLDEETKARKTPEEKFAPYVPSSSDFVHNSLDQQSSPPNGHRAVPSSTRCIVKSEKELGNVRMDTSPSIDSYNVIIDDIFDHGADLYEGEGTFEDVVLGRTIKWPRILVQML